MNPDTMSLVELRAWLAIDDGWTYVNSARHVGWWMHATLNDCNDGDHPHRDSIDGAAAAMPAGWFWMRDGGSEANPQGLLLKWVACQIGATRWGIVSTLDTGDEITDRYRLAVKCRIAEKESKHGN
jgi:hypothetical protein